MLPSLISNSHFLYKYMFRGKWEFENYIWMEVTPYMYGVCVQKERDRDREKTAFPHYCSLFYRLCMRFLNVLFSTRNPNIVKNLNTMQALLMTSLILSYK